MSADFPPPQQPAGGNPFAQQPAGGPAAPGGNPYAQQPAGGPGGPGSPGGNPYAQTPAGPGPYGQQPAPFGAPPQGVPAFNPAAYPPPVVAQRRENVGLGIAAGVAAAIVAALVYGLLIKGTKHEIGYAALGVGALVGLALGKAGGRNAALPVIGIPLALLGVYAGQLYGIALLNSGDGLTVTNIFLHHFKLLQHTWKHSLDAKDFLFFAMAGIEGFVITKRVAD